MGQQQDEVDARTISPRSCVRLDLMAYLSPPFEEMEMIKPITKIFEGTNLIFTQGSWFQRWEAELSDAFGGIARWKELGRMGMHPGTEARERSHMVIDCGVSQVFSLHILLPGDNIAFEAGRNPIMSIGTLKILQKAGEVQRDFLCHGAGERTPMTARCKYCVI